MNRRAIFQVMAAAVAAMPLVGRKAAAEGEKKLHRMAVHVDQNDPDVMRLALNNSRNAYDLYKERGEEVAVEIVCYSLGLHMLREDTSPVKAEIRELRKTFPQIAFGACNNTKMGMEKREGKPIPIIPEADGRARRRRPPGRAAGAGLRLREAVSARCRPREAGRGNRRLQLLTSVVPAKAGTQSSRALIVDRGVGDYWIVRLRGR